MNAANGDATAGPARRARPDSPPGLAADGFYVGYLPLPRAWRGFVVGTATLAVLAMGGIFAALASAQPAAGEGTWASDEVVLDGLLTLEPYPTLRAADPESVGRSDAQDAARAWLLVSSGKHGALDRARTALGGAAARSVHVRGLPLRRRDQRVLELIDGDQAITPLDAATPPTAQELGPIEVVGEVIDPKCWVGAMRPGSGLVHRACAELCIRGGIPPCFVGGPAGAPPRFFVLTDAEGRPCHDAVAGIAGVLVQLRATEARIGDVAILRVDTTSITPETTGTPAWTPR